MAITKVGQASNNTDNTTSMSIDISGISISDGDLMLFFGSCDGSGYTIPTGFTSIYDVDTLGSHNNKLAYRIASSEPSSYTVNTESGGERGIGMIAVYRGVDTVSPIESSNSNTGGEDTSAVITSLTPGEDNCAVCVFVGTEYGNAGNPIATFPAGVTEQLDNVNGPPGTGNASSAGAYGHSIQTTAAAVSGTITLSTSASYWGTMVVSLREAQTSTTVDSDVYGNIFWEYSKGSKQTLPTDLSPLDASYNSTEITNSSADNSTRVSQTGTGYVIHQRTIKNSNNTDSISVTWNGQTTTPPSSSTVYLQIWNANSSSWETFDSDNSTAKNTDFDLTANITSSLSNYYYGNNWVSIRVYQQHT